MANEVFANDLEIACKAADGKSVACFPDPCFSPPSPSAGWILIPYANTAYAKDTTNASKTVFISGKPIMKKDVSYFKKSTGNEPAAGPKGQFTGVKKGKAYFTSWSMNVKVEGQNVDRHTDGITHNHGSKPANTGEWKYLDTADEKKACAKDKKKMDNACEAKETKKKKNKRTGKMEDVNTNKSAKAHKKGEWRSHCKGLNKKPRSVTKEDLEKLKDKAEKAIEDFDAVAIAMDKIKEEIIDVAMKKGSIKAAKMLAKKPLQAVLGPLGWAWAAYDVYDGISTAVELNDFFDNVKKQAEELKKLPEKMKELDSLLEDFDGKKASKLMADIQSKLAVVDPCIRLRKCMLSPHGQTERKGKGNQACCHGQTGHHMIPDSYMTDSECKGYDRGKAPVVCVEGTNQYDGSHGKIHTALENAVQGEDDWHIVGENTISYNHARDAGVKSHKKTFPLSACSAQCLKAQMDNYRDKACGKGENSSLKYVPIVVPDDIERER